MDKQEANMRIVRHRQLTPQIRAAYESQDYQTAEALCLEDIELFSQCKEAYITYYPGDPLPEYPSFSVLTDIYEQQGRYGEAVAVCNMAAHMAVPEGDRGSFMERIVKLKKRQREIPIMHMQKTQSIELPATDDLSWTAQNKPAPAAPLLMEGEGPPTTGDIREEKQIVAQDDSVVRDSGMCLDGSLRLDSGLVLGNLPQETPLVRQPVQDLAPQLLGMSDNIPNALPFQSAIPKEIPLMPSKSSIGVSDGQNISDGFIASEQPEAVSAGFEHFPSKDGVLRRTSSAAMTADQQRQSVVPDPSPTTFAGSMQTNGYPQVPLFSDGWAGQDVSHTYTAYEAEVPDMQESVYEGSGSSWFAGDMGGVFRHIVLGWVLCALTMGIYTPWFICDVQRWRLSNTVVGGYRLQFTGTGKTLFWPWLRWTLLSMITFGIYSFWAYLRLEQWLAAHTFWVVETSDWTYDGDFYGQSFSSDAYGEQPVEGAFRQQDYGQAYGSAYGQQSYDSSHGQQGNPY